MTHETQCQGGCGKVRSILFSDSPKDWLCNECRVKRNYPKYTVNGRIMRDYDDALMYWQVYGGTMMETIDHMTPAHVLMSGQPESEQEMERRTR